jgi:hypothetical protein
MPKRRKERWLRVYNKLILDARDNVGGTRLLSKSPANTFRIKQLSEYYPDAKFIYLYRDPYSVLSSFRLFVTEVTKGVGFREISNEEFNACMIDLFQRMEEEYHAVNDPAIKENIVEVKFEDFIKDPLKTIQELYKKFDKELSPDIVREIKAQLSEFEGHTPGHYSLPPDVISLVSDNLANFLDSRGYEKRINNEQ